MKKSILTIILAALASMTFAQFRDGGKDGNNVFDSPKVETTFDGIKTTIGGGFTQSLQRLEHSNKPTVVNAANTLTPLSPGVNLASANLYFNTQLADGVAVKMELYLASRHHNETWVKGGYLQFDKLPFLKSALVDKIMKYTTIKVGQYDVNFGDAHFRRTDGADAIHNPFMDNNIMDAFATELGVEAAVNYNGIVGVLAVTDGLLKGSVTDEKEQSGYPENDLVNKTTASDGNRYPSIVAKLGYDKQITEKLRVRLTGSYYGNKGAISNTLLGGDRTGSNYYGVMYNAAPGTGTAFNGRYNPGFSDKIQGLAGNLFVKVRPMSWLALESFTTVEQMKGRGKSEYNGDRTADQFATDLIIRFGKDENFYIGGRYNTMTAQVDGPDATVAPIAEDVTIVRISGNIGWYITDNVLTKVEYVKQTFAGFDPNSIFAGGEFEGVVVQAVIGF
jgi:hypothetical protein